MGRPKLKKTKIVEETKKESNEVILPPTRMSDDLPQKQVRWINRQRVLVFATRGVTHRHRHLMCDIKTLMPHHKAESKMERCTSLYVVNELCEMKNCNNCLLFEGRKRTDLYLWISKIASGPCAKFLVENIYTMAELKMTGNCLRGSRPLLSFDPEFDKHQHFMLLKEMLVQIFGVPNKHPKSQPFYDHVYTFMMLDDRIWFRNYQILTEDGALVEIGPRFVLNPIKIFSGSFGGATLWENPKYMSPSRMRRSLLSGSSSKYQNRVEMRAVREANRPETGYPDISGLDIFHRDPVELAEEEIKDELMEEKKKAKSFPEKRKPKIKEVLVPSQINNENVSAKPKSGLSIKRKLLKTNVRRKISKNTTKQKRGQKIKRNKMTP